MDTSALLFGGFLASLLAYCPMAVGTTAASHPNCDQTDSTYVSTCVCSPCGKVIFGGVCQAMMLNMKTSATLALTESANKGLRPPIVDGIIMAACIQKQSKRATEGATIGVLLAKEVVQQAAQAGSGAQHILKDD
jgi:hypothetical protein